MAATWNIDVQKDNKRADILVIIFKETDGEFKETYKIAVPHSGTPAEKKTAVMEKLKVQVLERRTIRQKIRTIRTALDSATIEAFINS